MQLLCLVRFVPLNGDSLPAHEASELFAAALPDASGHQVNREQLETIVVFSNADRALQLLSQTMTAGNQEQFAISAGIVQAIASPANRASSLSGFTEGSIENLFAVTALAGQQEVTICERLTGLIESTAPVFFKHLDPVAIKVPGNGSVARVMRCQQSNP